MNDGGSTPVQWAYGVTTVPVRRRSTLPNTLASLAAGGFGRPYLFVDGGDDSWSWANEFGLAASCRPAPALGVAGAWVLALHELALRHPHADWYALFQDDILVCKNVRHYLDRSPPPDHGYGNLYLARAQYKKMLLAHGGLAPLAGWHRTDQKNPGALALVFPRAAVLELLGSKAVARGPYRQRGDRNIDGLVVTALNAAGWSEWAHCPTLTEHTGKLSTIGHLFTQSVDTWRGEGYDPLELLEAPCTPQGKARNKGRGRGSGT